MKHLTDEYLNLAVNMISKMRCIDAPQCDGLVLDPDQVWPNGFYKCFSDVAFQLDIPAIFLRTLATDTNLIGDPEIEELIDAFRNVILDLINAEQALILAASTMDCD